MRVVTPKKKNDLTKRKKDDPLSRLHQIHEDTPLDEREALFIISRILDDIENNNVIRDIVINEVLGLYILNHLDALIQGLKKERISRIYRAWDRRFITAFETVHIYNISLNH
jgi:hypothetical protein